MTLDALLSIALDLAFFAVFALSLIDWIRHRGAIRRVVVLVFASTAIVLGVPVIRVVLPGIGPGLDALIVPALLAQPVLVLWLVSYTRHVPRALLMTAAAAFVSLTAGLFYLAAGGVEPRSGLVIALALAALAYFALVDGAAAIGFALAARARAGASRSRLLTAAVATGLLGLAVVFLLAGGVLTSPGSDAAAVSGAVVRVLALLAALGYLAAFAPPRALRRVSQQAIVYDFIRDLNALPSGAPVERIWELLAATVRRASGAARVEVLHASAAGETGDPRTITVPFSSERWPTTRLELDLPEHALFLEDDLELTELLVDRAVRAAEREAFLLDREGLIVELQAASAAKSDFLAAMSHELRTPLNAIIGFSELLTEGGEDAGDPETVTNYAQHIHGSGLHLLELVNDVLDLARVEAGRLDLKPVPVELDALVRQTVAAVRPLADGKRLAVALQLAPATIEADPARVRQIILNLLSNAIKFTGDGGEIRVSLEADDRGAARLTVADTGQGIAESDLERIFEAFQQAPGEGMPTHHEGTGLGLALTRQLAEAHGGSVAVRSEVGVGSEFTVVLPARAGAAAQEAGPPALPADRPSVLVIEDDPAAQELLRRHLEGAGYAVIATASGRQGLAWMTEVHPDAVILDILLPDLDGWEILQLAKSDAATRSIPIMVVSVVDDRQLGLALGAVDYFVKPVLRERLLEGLGRLTFTTKVRTRTVTALVIDADPEAARRYRDLLEPDGFRVIDAASGGEGLRRAIADQPDLILLDALLPDVDGFELANTLHRDPATATIPIWVTTPTGLEPEAKVRLNGTVQGVLVRGDEGLVAMRQWLETPRRAAPGDAPA
ncbi:MAG TPA: response regulator [Candidatus Limnocylindrales bacterium]|nr:response regulator [Candidatus Limnocylindrales bacterium]